jgi:pimeloyl-ACP methyl ester carboxylesterase
VHDVACCHQLRSAWPLRRADVERQGPNGKYTLFRPVSTLGNDGFRHPIAGFGTEFVTPGSAYRTALTHLASHGFVVVACDEFGDRGCVHAGVQWLAQQNEAGAALADKLDLTREALLGHGLGYNGALAAAHRDNVKAVIAIHGLPAVDAGTPSAIDAPFLMLSSTVDTYVTRETTDMLYAAASGAPTLFAMSQDSSVDHGDIQKSGCSASPCAGGSQELGPVTAWLRLWLCDDQGARPQFFGADCGLCKAPWVTQRKPADYWQ